MKYIFLQLKIRSGARYLNNICQLRCGSKINSSDKLLDRICQSTCFAYCRCFSIYSNNVFRARGPNTKQIEICLMLVQKKFPCFQPVELESILLFSLPCCRGNILLQTPSIFDNLIVMEANELVQDRQCLSNRRKRTKKFDLNTQL